MHRRSFSTLAFATLAGTKIAGPASAQNVSGDLETQLQRFEQFPGTTSFRIDVGDDKLASNAPGRQLFVASTIKTFILCQYLRDVEAGRLSEDEQLSVDDNVRTESSPVFQNLTGTTLASSILEAMIAHSDNTATDIALLQVDPDRVRSFIAAEGFRATLIPDSTRRWFSYNVGAPLGVDIGWSGVQQVLASQQPLGPPHPALNHQETLASSADNMVSYYKRVMAGEFFTQPTTLQEFKRILLFFWKNSIFPDDTIVYAKGGSVDALSENFTVSHTADFHALAVAGQMVVNATPVTFCFSVNWMSADPNSTSTTLGPAFNDVVKGSLEAIKGQLLTRSG
jgi:beta-lactamase class A